VSFNINQFLEEIVKKQLPDLAMTNPYLGAGVIAGAIEFLGNCLDNDPLDSPGLSAHRFCYAINELFPPPYHQFSRVAPYTKNEKPTHDLYTSLRCGMAHVLRPQGVLLTGSIEEATTDGNTHLQIINKDGKDFPLIIVEQFRNDFVLAVEEVERRLAAGAVPSKLSGSILNVWES
jgi:hypothetical protein